GSSQRTDSFSREVLRLSSRLGARTRDVSSTGLLAGVDGEIFHTPLLLLPPAIPLVVNEDGFAAGGYVREGQTQLLFLAFSADRLPAERRERLIADALRVLERDEEVELDFPGALKVGNCVVVEPGERITVTATSRQKVTELVMWSGTDMRPFRVSAMSDVGGSYSGSFVAPAAGGFAVAARVVGEAGTPALVGPSIQVLPVSLREKADVLAFLPDDVRFVSDNLRETISRLGLEADLVPNRVTDMEMLGFLLNRAEGDAVVWASDDVWEGEMAALSAFVENGGRLMLFSDELPDTEWGAAFLGAAVGITEIGVGFRYRSFPVGPAQDGVTVRLQSRAFSIDASAQALLRDSQEKISGVHKATDTFRVVFLPLSLRSLGTREVDTPFLAGLFQRGLQLLTQEFDGPVGISSIRAPAAVTRIGPLRPEIVVTNETDLPSTAFRVGFRVSVSDSVVANFEHIEEPLDAGAERTITLGEWPSLNEREVEIRVGVGWLDGDLAYLPPQNVHVLDLQDRFGQVHLPTATGAGFFDFDGDADDDLYLVRQDQENVLFRNDGAGVFADAGADAGLAHAGRGRGIAVSDFDGDGDLDVYLVNEESNRLYGNTGAGQFVDWTAASSAHPDPERSLADASSGRSAGFFDGDRDGDLDLYVVNAAAANRFFENTNGLFTERAAEVGLDDAGDGRGLTFGDYDGDADVDLFVANLDGNALLRNDGGRYTEVHAAAGITAVPDGIGGVFGDYDNDGDLDLFVACLASDNRLYRNRGDGNYEIATGQDLDLGAAS
ncbi:MAG: VCBS repeat-containing protein, partial [Dehalococcoidia bacterium]|nr:VCBS repeat-containing protein [Dehalococcoidia bacterium]